MTSKTRMRHSWIACALLLVAAGCASRQAPPPGRGTPGAAAERPTSPEPAGETELTDAEVAKVLDTVNRGEIQQAELAIAKARSAEVRDYAQRMLEEHRNALERANRVVVEAQMQPETSALDQQLAMQAQSKVTELAALDPALFDREYILSQIEMHRQVLDLIDTVLLPSTDDPELRAEVEAVRPVISSHLSHAEQIEDSPASVGG